MIQELFDRLAAGYDQDVIESDKENAFPFAGYQKTLDFIADEIAGRARLGEHRERELLVGGAHLLGEEVIAARRHEPERHDQPPKHRLADVRLPMQPDYGRSVFHQFTLRHPK